MSELPPLPEPAYRTNFGAGLEAYSAHQLRAYAAAAVALERERCAKAAERAKFTGNTFPVTCCEQMARDCAAAIRARGVRDACDLLTIDDIAAMLRAARRTVADTMNEQKQPAVAGPVEPTVRPHGWDGRKWRYVKRAVPCKHCGATPIAARSVAGWSLACPNDKAHGYLFEQWIEKCRRRWAVFHAA